MLHKEVMILTGYTTVRIDKESMKKLEEIADLLQNTLNINISKASALKYIINEEYERSVDSLKNLTNKQFE